MPPRPVRLAAPRTTPPALAIAAAGLLAALTAAALAGCSPAARPAVRPHAAEPALFTDMASSAGLHYAWTIPGPRPLNILQTIGNGCAFLDFDNDGNLDILLVGPKLALYKGDGHGHFADVTHETGLDQLHGHFLGCAVGDYDNDGYDDLYVSAYRGGVLLHNEPTLSPQPSTLNPPRRFRDVTAQSGIAPQPWGTSAAFVETVPGSGRLDLYVCDYAVFGPKGVPQLCEEHGVMTSCGPRSYTPLHGVLYRNDGGGRFHDATAASGLSGARGRALGVAFADYDACGRPAIALANDEMPGDLMHPVASKRAPAYTNVGDASGTAYDRDGNVHGGMGLDWGDVDGDGRLDLFVATFQNEPKALYHNDGGSFTDVSMAAGIGAPTTPFVAFGCKLFDYDNDGRLDLVIANGHVQDNIQQIDSAQSYRQHAQLLHNVASAAPGRGGCPVRFDEVTGRAGPAFARGIVGRGLAVGDFDNDGRLDVLMVDSEGSPLLLHNDAPAAGHWLGVRLEGARCNRDGYGALLTAEAGGRRLVRLCQSAGSYMSASDRRVHFGLGASRQVDTLTIRWPDGRTDVLRHLAADRYVTVREGSGHQ